MALAPSFFYPATLTGPCAVLVCDAAKVGVVGCESILGRCTAGSTYYTNPDFDNQTYPCVYQNRLSGYPSSGMAPLSCGLVSIAATVTFNNSTITYTPYSSSNNGSSPSLASYVPLQSAAPSAPSTYTLASYVPLTYNPQMTGGGSFPSSYSSIPYVSDEPYESDPAQTAGTYISDSPFSSNGPSAPSTSAPASFVSDGSFPSDSPSAPSGTSLASFASDGSSPSDTPSGPSGTSLASFASDGSSPSDSPSAPSGTTFATFASGSDGPSDSPSGPSSTAVSSWASDGSVPSDTPSAPSSTSFASFASDEPLPSDTLTASNTISEASPVSGGALPSDTSASWNTTGSSGGPPDTNQDSVKDSSNSGSMTFNLIIGSFDKSVPYVPSQNFMIQAGALNKLQPFLRFASTNQSPTPSTIALVPATTTFSYSFATSAAGTQALGSDELSALSAFDASLASQASAYWKSLTVSGNVYISSQGAVFSSAMSAQVSSLMAGQSAIASASNALMSASAALRGAATAIPSTPSKGSATKLIGVSSAITVGVALPLIFSILL